MQSCHYCGVLMPDNLNFCTACGTKRQEVTGASLNACSGCHAELPEGALFCPECGAKANSSMKHKVPGQCDACGIQNHVDMNFCLACGTPLKKTMQQQTPFKQQVASPHQIYLNPAPVSYEQPSLLQRKAHKGFKKIKILGLIAGTLAVLIAAYTILPNMIKGFRSGDGPMSDDIPWVLAGDLDETRMGSPEEVVGSGSRPVSIRHDEGLTISAEAHALDQDRDFTVRRLKPEETQIFLDNPAHPAFFTVAAYDIHAGLKEEESFPGDVALTFDLSSFNIPKEAFEDIRILRVGSGDDFEILRGHLDGGAYHAYTNRNSVFIITWTIIGAAGLFGGLGIHEGHKKFTDAFGPNPKFNMANYYKDNTYTLYWPTNLGMANPKAVADVLLEEYAIYKKLGLLDEAYNPQPDIDKVLAGEKPMGIQDIIRDQMRSNPNATVDTTFIHALGTLYQDPDFQALRKKCDDAWKVENTWPEEAKVCLEQLMRANDYLFKHRKLRKPSSVEVFLSPLMTNYGESFNPSTGRPYLTVSVIPKKGLQNRTDPDIKKWLDNYLITIAHELLHCAQGSRYTLVDWNSNTWFWEATATLLENEAAEYFIGENVIDPGFTVEKHDYYEAYGRAPGLTGYWGDLKSNLEAGTAQGYMTGYLLMFLRDRYYGTGTGKQGKDQFLPNLLNAFRGSLRSPFYIIVAQTSNSEKKIREDFQVFYASVAKEIARRTNMARLTSGISIFTPWVITDKVILSEKSPIATLLPFKNPYASLVRVLDVDLGGGKHTKDDIRFVLQKGKEAMHKAENLYLQVSLDGEPYEPMKEEEAQAYDGFKSAQYVEIQEMHLYGDGWFTSFSQPYRGFLMFRPSAPKIEEKTKGKDKIIVLEMPNPSPLFAQGLVKKWRVTFTDPLGKTVIFETDKNLYEIPISEEDGSPDFNSPQIKKDMEKALQSQMAIDENLKEGVASGYKGNTGKLIDDIVKGVDLGALNRSAQILFQGGLRNKYSVSVCEVVEAEKPIYGPESPVSELEVTFGAAGTDLTGVWQGKLAFTNETMKVTFKPGRDGHSYIMVLHYYEDAEVYVDDLGNGQLKISTIPMDKSSQSIEQAGAGAFFFDSIMTLNSKNEIQMIAPPCTLKRQKQ